MRERWSGFSRQFILGGILGIAVCWMVSGQPIHPALAQGPGTVESSGTIAFTSAGTASSQLLYLIDTKTQAFAIYRVDPLNGKGTVKLEAARQYRWDLKLAEYNNQPPDVASIESMVGTPRK